MTTTRESELRPINRLFGRGIRNESASRAGDYGRRCAAWQCSISSGAASAVIVPGSYRNQAEMSQPEPLWRSG